MFIVNSLSTVNHTNTVKKIPDNQQKEMYDIFKTHMIKFYVKFVRNKQFILNNELFGHICFEV